MNIQALKKLNTEPALALKEAFEKFNESANRLQDKYEDLLREVEVLRAQLKAKEEEMRRNERLAMLGETASALAHEVRNPLGSLRLFASLLRKDLLDKPSSLSLVCEIEESISSLDHVVSNILCFSKLETLPCAPLNLHILVQDEVSRLNREQSGKIECLLNLSGNPFIYGNDHALRQVIRNLLINSFQAIKGRGQIDLKIEDIAERVLLEIHDNGPGFSEEILGQVFDPFVTNKKEGTGLGLAIVKRIINQHAGNVSATNQDGAVIRIELPRQPRKELSSQ